MERDDYSGYTVTTLAKIAAATRTQLDVRFVDVKARCATGAQVLTRSKKRASTHRRRVNGIHGPIARRG